MDAKGRCGERSFISLCHRSGLFTWPSIVVITDGCQTKFPPLWSDRKYLSTSEKSGHHRDPGQHFLSIFFFSNGSDWKIAFSCLLRSAQYRQEEGRRENATLQSLPFPPRYIQLKEYRNSTLWFSCWCFTRDQCSLAHWLLLPRTPGHSFHH